MKFVATNDIAFSKNDESYENYALENIAQALAATLFWSLIKKYGKSGSTDKNEILSDMVHVMDSFQTLQAYYVKPETESDNEEERNNKDIKLSWRKVIITDLTTKQRIIVQGRARQILKTKWLGYMGEPIDIPRLTIAQDSKDDELGATQTLVASESEAAAPDNGIINDLCEESETEAARKLMQLNNYCEDYLKDLAEKIKKEVAKANQLLYQSVFRGRRNPSLENDIENILGMLVQLERNKKQLSKNEYKYLKLLQSKFTVVAQLREFTNSQEKPSEKLKKCERHVLDNFYLLKKNEDSGFNFISKVLKTIYSGFKLWNTRGDQFVRDVTTLFHPKREKEKEKRVQSTIPINPNAIRIIKDLENESPTSSSLRS